ncbi:MAG: DNA polymerase III subunit gamma/tau [Dehalococcoidia bacterium]|nr:DNA polymerase III subunit gamma/tau [Dehalococcoidia bacterium]
MSPVLYRKWRSQSFSELMGQEHVTRTLLNALASGRVSHAYLFCGPRGTGKTSTARILAKAINCQGNNGLGEPCNECSMCHSITEGRALDLIEIDAASNRRIEEIRDLREKVNFVPNEARRKVYIIDEVHMLTKEAFNALLKTLEEPPAHTVFILATTEAHQVPSTIISRCQRFDFRRIPIPQMIERLSLICQEEGITVHQEVLELLARRATGSLRDAENMLDQLVANHGVEVSLSQVQELLGLTSDQRVHELARLTLKTDVTGGLASISSIADDGIDPRQFARQLVDHLRQLLLLKMGAPSVDLTPESKEEMLSLVKGIGAQDLVRAIKLFGQADVRLEAPSTLPLELALVEYSLAHDQPAERPIADTPTKAAAPTGRETPTSPAPPARPKIAAFPAPVSGDPLDQLTASWPRILAEVRQVNKQVEALLRSSCRVIAVDSDTVTIAFSFEIHKSKLDDPKMRRVVEDIISRALGRRHEIQCVLSPKEAPRASPASQQSTVPAHSDPVVDMAVREFGARIVSHSKTPRSAPDDFPEIDQTGSPWE